ncbi:MAG: DUF2911 domain-containing protein [Acidobacteria bacterium]|nr:DUF2911 domain-containing protein [Acidobacteriota bacterium]
MTHLSLVRRGVISAVVLGLALVAVPEAQQQRASPHETVSATINGAKVSITYGRPYMKGRAIFGGLVPWDQVWRTGADEATTLTSDKMVMIGNLHISPGSVTLWTLPTEKGAWKVVVNKETGQWGTAYKAENDLGRVDMKTETLPTAVEQFTITIEPVGNGGQIVMMWEKTKMIVPFSAM